MLPHLPPEALDYDKKKFNPKDVNVFCLGVLIY